MRTVLYLALSTLWSLLTIDAKAVSTVDDGDCRPRLKAQILTCLLQFEGLLFVYQRPGTSETQRQDMLTDMCHQYEETLQCLHESLLGCVADMPSLQLIASRLGPIRTFMEVTCYISPRRITPTPGTPPTTPATPPTMSNTPSTTETMVRTTMTVPPRTVLTVTAPPRTSTEDTTITRTKESKSQTTSTTTDTPTTTKKIQRVSRSTPLTTPVNSIKSELHTNTKGLFGGKTEQSLVGNLAMTDSIDCEDTTSSERRLLCLQQRPTVNAAVNKCHYTVVHLGVLIAAVMTTVFLR